MICGKCGYVFVKDSSKYCNQCGCSVEIKKSKTPTIALVSSIVILSIFSALFVLVLMAIGDQVENMRELEDMLVLSYTERESMLIHDLMYCIRFWYSHVFIMGLALILIGVYLYRVVVAKKNPTIKNYKVANVINIIVMGWLLLLLIVSIGQIVTFVSVIKTLTSLGDEVFDVTSISIELWIYIVSVAASLVALVFSRYAIPITKQQAEKQ